jgi:hypothetical protein
LVLVFVVFIVIVGISTTSPLLAPRASDPATTHCAIPKPYATFRSVSLLLLLFELSGQRHRAQHRQKRKHRPHFAAALDRRVLHSTSENRLHRVVSAFDQLLLQK